MTSYVFTDNILHVNFEGKITSKELFEFLDEFGTLEGIPAHCKLFFDLRKASISLKLDEISKLSEVAEEKTQKCESVKTAFCVEDPKITAYTMLFSWLPKNSKIKRKQFSTKEAALEWLSGNNDIA